VIVFASLKLLFSKVLLVEDFAFVVAIWPEERLFGQRDWIRVHLPYTSEMRIRE
jgi:hypothetical protein